MSKMDYADKMGIEVIKTTIEDRNAGETDYQRNADYILVYNGTEMYSSKASLKDMKYLVENN